MMFLTVFLVPSMFRYYDKAVSRLCANAQEMGQPKPLLGKGRRIVGRGGVE
jgi:hypothetical protein